jgi:ABC-type glutathione transport system ATPase component
VASCIEPDILLVDEVLAVGDAAFRQKCLKRIQSLIDEGTSILFVSHNLYMVQAVCQQSLYLKKGRTQLLGDTKTVIEAYENDLHAERASKFEFEAGLSGDAPGEGIEITRVEILDQTGAKPDSFSSQQPAKIQVHYLAYQDLGPVNVSVFVIRSDGLTCFMLRTKLHEFKLAVQRGVGMVTVDLSPMQLITGTYFIEAWFLNEADSTALTPTGGRSDWFTVKGLARSYEESSGVYEPVAHWNHQVGEFLEGSSQFSEDSTIHNTEADDHEGKDL